jgi:hypothetical protein
MEEYAHDDGSSFDSRWPDTAISTNATDVIFIPLMGGHAPVLLVPMMQLLLQAMEVK